MNNTMKKMISLAISGWMIAAISCNHPQPEVKPVPTDVVAAPPTIKIDVKTLAMDIDPECKMSLSEGVGDTATVNGKLYGFCSAGCKSSYIAENTVKDTLKK